MSEIGFMTQKYIMFTNPNKNLDFNPIQKNNENNPLINSQKIDKNQNYNVSARVVSSNDHVIGVLVDIFI